MRNSTVPILHSKSPVTLLSRSAVGNKRTLLLYVQAGGRCELEGCGKYVLKHSVTQTVGNFGDIAHIVAFNERGPRGKKRARGETPHDMDNLMLLCNECHRLIDRNPLAYPVHSLKKHKKRHEDEVYFATGIQRNQKTAIVRLEAPIAGKPASIPLVEIHEAILPRHPLEKPRCIIELNQQAVVSDDAASLKAAAQIIKDHVKDFLKSGMAGERVDHISVFALAPIPLLVVLGDQLSNTVPLDVYHHHHDKDNWVWKRNVKHVTYKHKLIQKGTDTSRVALLICASGTVQRATLPATIDRRFFIYQIRTSNFEPSTNALATREGLENFRRTYEDWRRKIRRVHVELKQVHLFPAVSPPIAFLCGRELMSKVDPALQVYEFNKRLGGFNFILEVNPNER